MCGSAAQRFAAALQEAEAVGDPSPLEAMFADDAELDSIARAEPLHGRDGVRQFWQAYLEMFESIHTEFSNIIDAPESAVLEWESDAVRRNGRPVTYRGVSVLEFDGDRVRRFCTYYDSAAFANPVAAAHAE